jgi:hypothetical protein
VSNPGDKGALSNGNVRVLWHAAQNTPSFENINYEMENLIFNINGCSVGSWLKRLSTVFT